METALANRALAFVKSCATRKARPSASSASAFCARINAALPKVRRHARRETSFINCGGVGVYGGDNNRKLNGNFLGSRFTAKLTRVQAGDLQSSAAKRP